MRLIVLFYRWIKVYSYLSRLCIQCRTSAFQMQDFVFCYAHPTSSRSERNQFLIRYFMDQTAHKSLFL